MNWTYKGDAFAICRAGSKSDAGLWAPDIHFFNNQYYLYYTASDTACRAAAPSAWPPAPARLGPWTDSGGPVVEPHDAPAARPKMWIFDPDRCRTPTARIIFYGSYFGGGRPAHCPPMASIPIRPARPRSPSTIATKALTSCTTAAIATFRLGHQLLQRAPTGYSVFAGRSANILGPMSTARRVKLLAVGRRLR